MTNNEIKRLRDMLAQLPQHGSGRAARIALDALPGLLDEVERLRAALEVTPAPVTLEAAEWAIGVFRAKEEQMRADAARLNYIEKHARYDPKMDGNHAWWPTTFENVLRGPTLRAAIDAAMGEDGSAT